MASLRDLNPCPSVPHPWLKAHTFWTRIEEVYSGLEIRPLRTGIWASLRDSGSKGAGLLGQLALEFGFDLFDAGEAAGEFFGQGAGQIISEACRGSSHVAESAGRTRGGWGGL